MRSGALLSRRSVGMGRRGDWYRVWSSTSDAFRIGVNYLIYAVTH